MILETFLACNCAVLASKMIHTKVDKIKEIRKNILEQGLYHITKEENADSIIQQGVINPSNNVLSMGRKKVFFFAGIPELEAIRENIRSQYRQYEWTAVKIMPQEADLANYKTRVMGDNSVIYKGKCELDSNKVKKVKLVLDLNKEGNLYLREKTPEEIEKGDYVPPDEVKQKFEVSQNPIQLYKDVGTAYLGTFKRLYNIIKTTISKKRKRNIEERSEEQQRSTKEERKQFMKRIRFKVKSYKKTSDALEIKQQELNQARMNTYQKE